MRQLAANGGRSPDPCDQRFLTTGTLGPISDHATDSGAAGVGGKSHEDHCHRRSPCCPGSSVARRLSSLRRQPHRPRCAHRQIPFGSIRRRSHSARGV